MFLWARFNEIQKTFSIWYSFLKFRIGIPAKITFPQFELITWWWFSIINLIQPSLIITGLLYLQARLTVEAVALCGNTMIDSLQQLILTEACDELKAFLEKGFSKALSEELVTGGAPCLGAGFGGSRRWKTQVISRQALPKYRQQPLVRLILESKFHSFEMFINGANITTTYEGSQLLQANPSLSEEDTMHIDWLEVKELQIPHWRPWSLVEAFLYSPPATSTQCLSIALGSPKICHKRAVQGQTFSSEVNS